MAHKKKQTVWFIALFIFASIAAAACFCAYRICIPLESQSGTKAHTEYRIIVPSGATLRTVARDLKKNGIISSPDFFYFYGCIKGVFLKAGIYKVNAGMSIPEICAVLESGKQEYIAVSLSEGLTIRKIAEILEKNGITSADDFIKAASSRALLSEFGIPADSFEGYLFPDTYNLDYGMSPERVVRILASTFFEKIKKLEALNGKSARELHDTVILASIVEREYRLEEEAPLIASVFTNRLKRNIGLYSCATLVYVLTEIEGRAHPDVVKIEDTKIDNPYNTYKWAGLPPGPISNPGLTALKAAASPPQTKYYYFRLTDAERGRHVFSETFDGHKEAAPVVTKRAAH
ncbi:endolytic transglycosylase MltG [Treponema sp. HNW]|uniref:endolytic transglycosylase MltG n=1 Tax=Treponema sp. HNW TaxID=3116654 RepID=UPI003D147AA2